jgi:hypothetical protein
VDKGISIRKPYKTPQATKLTLEQAELKLLWHEAEENEGAKDLLRLLGSDPSVLEKKKPA